MGGSQLKPIFKISKRLKNLNDKEWLNFYYCNHDHTTKYMLKNQNRIDPAMTIGCDDSAMAVGSVDQRDCHTMCTYATDKLMSSKVVDNQCDFSAVLFHLFVHFFQKFCENDCIHSRVSMVSVHN